MSQLATFTKRYWLVFYWLAFACLAADWGQRPGLIPRSQPLPPYPWVGVVVTWAILAVEVGILYAILYRVGSEKRSPWQRLRSALIYTFCLSVFEVLTGATDLPGYLYVTLYSAVVSFVILFVVTLVFGLTKLWGRFHHAP